VKHNLASERPPRELLLRLMEERGVHAVLNPRSPAYKERNLGGQTISAEEAIALIMEDPNLVRRPLVLGGKGKAVLGYDPAEYEKLR
jgi:arsenate reductase